jgi:hypothetical protein
MSKQTQIRGILGAAQEFIDTNPNEATALADCTVLIEALQSELNPICAFFTEEEEPMPKQPQIRRLLETIEEFMDTNPNEVTALADSAVLIEVLQSELNPKETTEVD